MTSIDLAPRVAREDTAPADGPAADLQAAIYAAGAAALEAHALDPVLTETIRLRCAQYHGCRFCGSLRMKEALDSGFDEDVSAQIGRYATSDLDAATKAALRLTDAMIATPGHVDPEVIADVRAHLTDAQIAEVTFDILKWAMQKRHVSLRLEGVPWEGLAEMAFDADGGLVLGETRAVTSGLEPRAAL